MLDISVIVPLYNEEESLPELHAWIKRVMEAHRFSYEIIFVNDGSTDQSWKVVETLREQDPLRQGHQVSPQLRQEPGPPLRFRRRRAASSSRWTPTSRTLPTRYRPSSR